MQANLPKLTKEELKSILLERQFELSGTTQGLLEKKEIEKASDGSSFYQSLINFFKGRINRIQFYSYQISIIVTFCITKYLLLQVDINDNIKIFFSLSALITVKLLYISILIKRSHDRNKSGYFITTMLLLDTLLSNIQEYPGLYDFIYIIRNTTRGLFLFPYIELLFFPGIDGKNTYGSPPN